MLKNITKQLIPTTYKVIEVVGVDCNQWLTYRFNEKVLMQIANHTKIRILEQTIHNPHYTR